MVLNHLRPGVALGTFVSTTRAASTDKVLSLSHHSVPKEVFPQPGFSSFDSLVSSCRHLVAKAQYLSSQVTGHNQNSFFSTPSSISFQRYLSQVVFHGRDGQNHWPSSGPSSPSNQSKIKPNSGSLDWLRLISPGLRPTRDVGPSKSAGETPITQAN